MGAYKRLLPCALEAASGDAGEGAGKWMAPHLSKVYTMWPAQQKQAMTKIAQMGKQSKNWITRRKKTFGQLRAKLGEVALDGVFRVTWEGEIIFDREEAEGRGIKFSRAEVESCLMLYSFYTLALGAPREVKSKLAEMLANKLA